MSRRGFVAAALLVVGCASAPTAIEKIRLDVAQDEAAKIEDLVRRKDALVKVLRDKETFVAEYKGTPAAEDARNELPDLYALLGETFVAAIKREKDDKAIDVLRVEGDAIFVRAEQSLQKRMDELKPLVGDDRNDDYARYRAARYNHAHTLYFHALLFAPGSARRVALCNTAIDEYTEFDLDFHTEEEDALIYYAYMDAGLCLKEIGKPDEAIASFEQTIELRDAWGPRDETTGVFPIPANARDTVDLVCYAMLQKALVLRGQKKIEKAVEVASDYFKSVPTPFDAASAMALAKQLAEAQLAVGK